MSKITTVLCVEDSDLDMERITRTFKRLDIQVNLLRARDGVEALEVLRRKEGQPELPRPYAVLLDLNMPRMGGLEMLSVLRQDESLKATPVFVLTTSDYHDDVQAAYNHNVCGYFVKSADRKEFVRTVEALQHYWESCFYPGS